MTDYICRVKIKSGVHVTKKAAREWLQAVIDEGAFRQGDAVSEDNPLIGAVDSVRVQSVDKE